DADVLAPGAARERMNGRVEAPRALVEAEPAYDLEREGRLALARELSPGGDLGPRGAGNELHERRLVLRQVLEERPHLRRLHPRLEVVEEGVVGLVELALVALDVAAAKLEVLAESGQERREVVALAGVDPHR